MTDFRFERNSPPDLAPLERLLRTRDDLHLVNPNAKFPFDALEWQERCLAEPDDASFYLLDETEDVVGFLP